MTLGRRLRELRVGCDPYLRQRDAAVALGVTFVWLSQVESGRVKPSEEFLLDAAVLYVAPGARYATFAELRALWMVWQESPPLDATAGPCSGRRLRS